MDSQVKEMRTRYLLFAFVFILAAAPLLAGTAYYVDAANGSDANNGTSPATPWKTINKVNTSVFVPGDSILFKRGGTWRETLTPPSHGASGNNITFGAYGSGDLPKLDGTGLANCLTSNKDYITVTDLHFYNSADWGIKHTKWDANGHILSTPGWIIENCAFTACGAFLFGPNGTVQDCTFNGPANRTADQAAIAFSGPVSSGCSVLRNTISNFTSRGIWFMGVGGTATANDNVIHDIAYTVGTNWEGYGINFDGFASPITGTVTALRNTIFNCAANGIETENCSAGAAISDNLIHDCGRAGILCMNYAARAASGPYPAYPEQRGKSIGALISYNILYHCLYGTQMQNVSGVDIWNNTIYDGLGSSPCGLVIYDAGTYFVTDIDLRNTVIGSGMTRAVSTEKAWRNHLSAFDYNGVINSVIEVRSPSSTQTLTQLQSGGAALNCFTTSPGFVDAAGHDYHLLPEAPCINSGVFVGLTKDHDGKSIDGAPDIGAYESGPPTTTTTPLVTTLAPSAIQLTTATDGGIVTADGGATVTERGICWSLTANPAISGSRTHEGSGTGSFASSLTGLSPNTMYHARAYAINSLGTGYGSDIAFRTLQETTLPSATTSAIASITSTSASGGGLIASDGGATVTERGHCWGLTASPATSGSHTHDGSGTGSFTSSVTGLTPNMAYHARAYATNSLGTAYGNDIAFSTTQGMTLPSITTSAMTLVTSTSASGGGSVTSDGGATVTERGICWGLTASPAIAGSHTHDGSGTGSYVSNLTGLTPNMTYHVRAYATNASGTAYGADLPFTSTALEVYTIPFREPFSGPSLPFGWTTYNEGVGILDKWTISETSMAGGSPNEASYTWQDVNPGTSRLISPRIDTTGYSVLYLNFRQVLTTFGSGGVTIKIQTSPDASVWTDETWSVSISDSNAGPEVVSTLLTQNLNRTTTYVAFLISGNLHYFDKWYIDDVGITATPPGTLRPPILSSPRNGKAYMPTIVDCTWLDTNAAPQERGYRIRIKQKDGEYNFVDVGQNVKSLQFSGLPTNKRFFWNVMALGEAGESADSPWANSGRDRQFTTGSMTTLLPPLPMGAASAGPDQPTSVILQWQDTNSNPEELKYEVRIKKDRGKYVRYSAASDAIKCLISNLPGNTKYIWNVRAKGDRKTTMNSAWGNSGSDLTFQTGQ
jgi:hypothetical protein